MKIEIDTRKSIYENISDYYEKIKKLKKKIENLEKLIKENEEKLNNINIEIERKEKIYKRKKEWYEKFRWFFTSNNFLLIAGKDSITNEILIRKYLDKNDLIFHADIHGSPFGILKNGINAKEEDIIEAAKFVGSYSRAWKEGIGYIDVYYVKPEQVSKKAPSGEYLKKGSFMIYGEKNYIKTQLEIALGFDDYIIPGVPESVSKKTNKYAILKPGNIKTLEIAKELEKIFGLDKNIIINFIPGPSIIYKIYK